MCCNRLWFGFVKRLLSYGVVALGFLCGLQGRGDTAPLRTEEIVEKVLERARAVQAQNPPAFYEYTRSTVTEELDEKGAVKKRQEKRSQLIRPKRPNKNQSSSQQGTASLDSRGSSGEERDLRTSKRARKEFILDRALLDRFEFQFVGREELNGRPVYLLAFEPKKDLPIREIQDRVINKIVGKVWVDEQEFEVARIDLRLMEKVTVGWGLIGAMHDFHLLLERIRMAEGVWLDHQTTGSVQYRKIFDSASTRWRETTSGHRKIGSGSAESNQSAGGL
jgi:hypothetical protein